MVYRYSIGSDWANIFGLTSSDLSVDQLEKILSTKLIEFASLDQRVEKIIGDRLLNEIDPKHILAMKRIKTDEIKKLTYIKARYNECIALHSDKLEKLHKKAYYSSIRKELVLWDYLSDGNKAQEIVRWLDGKTSIIQLTKIDFNWVNDNHKWLMEQVIDKIFNSKGTNGIINMISHLPEKYLAKNIDRIFKYGKTKYIFLLSNEHTSEKVVTKILREVAGLKNIPKVNATLNKSIFNALPSVMRLKSFESLLFYSRRPDNLNFSDIKTEKDLTPLLFGTSLKYNQRVCKVVQRFKYYYGRNKDEHV